VKSLAMNDYLIKISTDVQLKYLLLLKFVQVISQSISLNDAFLYSCMLFIRLHSV